MRIGAGWEGRVDPLTAREELGLRAGQEVEVSFRDGRIEIEPVAPPMRLVERDGTLVAETDIPQPALSAGQVRDALEHVRR